ncbi:MAG TPA: hypothetical protein VD927_16925 [Chryseosolibacter sp.]|nr:hypothetical protein [Chryseosolibacter sp.]
MTKGNIRLLITLFVILAALAVGWIAGRSLFVTVLHSKVEEQLYALRDEGYIVEYDSIRVDWDENVIEVFKLSVKRDIDTALCASGQFLSAHYIRAEGFDVPNLLFRRILQFSLLRLDSPKLSIYDNFFLKDTVARERSTFAINIEQLSLPDLVIERASIENCSYIARYNANISMSEFALAFSDAEPTVFRFKEMQSDSIRIVRPDDFYTFKIQRIYAHRDSNIFRLDTLTIHPHFGKIEFGRKVGFQTDRFEGMIPYVNMYGLRINTGDTTFLIARKITTQLFLKAFRDKRIPMKDVYKPLPIEQLNSLFFGLKVDSIVLNKSLVVYEEFAEDADSSGHVKFDNLFALIRNVDNTNGKKGQTYLSAESTFMGQGNVQLHATFPHDPRVKHKVTGKITNINLSTLNKMLEPVAGVRVEHGHLNKLTFAFSANNEHAGGEIELFYDNLKLITFKDKDDGKKGNHNEKRKDGFKTFIVNTFIVKKDMDHKTPKEKRRGTIGNDRVLEKYIFNYWWKSVASGLKSAYNVDKLEDSKLLDALKGNDEGSD